MEPTAENLDQLRQQTESLLLSDGESAALEEVRSELSAARQAARDEAAQLRTPAEPAAAPERRRQRKGLRRFAREAKRLERAIDDELLERQLYATCARKLGGIGRVRALDALILVLIFVVIGLLIVEWTVDIGERTATWLLWIDTGICAVFLGEFAFKFLCSASRWWYFRTRWIELVASLPLALFVEGMRVARFGRLLRLARVARLARLARVVRAVVFLRNRLSKSIALHRDALDREYPISITSARAWLEGLEERTRGRRDAAGRAVVWLIRQAENSTLFRWVDRLVARLGRPRPVPKSARRRLEAAARAEAAGKDGRQRVGRRLADLLGRFDAARQYLCDFNGIVTTPQLFNYVGKALFAAGKRRGIVLLAAGALGAFFAFLLEYAFGPLIAPWLGLSYEAVNRVAHQTQESFGLNFVLISLPFLAIAILGWIWVRKSKATTEEYRNVAEASYLNLLEDAKKLTMLEDLGWLYDEILQPEAVLQHGRDAVEQAERAVQAKVDAVLAEQRAEDPDYSIHDLAYEPRLFHPGGPPCDFSDDELAMTRTGFVLEAVQNISRRSAASGVHNEQGNTVVQLYRDYLDGALFHDTDRKTIEQLLGNITIRRVLDAIGYTNADRKRLQRLTTALGPNLWLTFIFRSIAEETGRLVCDFNASCAPLRDVRGQEIRGSRELYDRHLAWLDGGPRAYAKGYLTHEFHALHFLTADPAQDRRVGDLFGDAVLAKLRRDRARMIHTIFGTYPVRQTVHINPYRLYRRLLGVPEPLPRDASRLRQAARTVRTSLALALLPVRLLFWGLEGAVAACRWLKRFLLEILADIEVETPLPDYDAALRKITRMRGPVIAEASAIRARFDFAYAGCDGAAGQADPDACPPCLADLESVDASEGALAFYDGLRKAWDRRLRDLDQFLARHVTCELDGVTRRAVQTAYLLDADGLRTLVGAHEHVAAAERALAAQQRGWLKGQRLRLLRRLIVRWLLLGHDHASRTFRAYCELVDRPRRDRATSRLFRAYLLDSHDLRKIIDACVETDGRAKARALDLIDDIADGHHGEWTARLVTVRTVHALSLLDRRNYEAAVYRLGRFHEAGAVLPGKGRAPTCAMEF